MKKMLNRYIVYIIVAILIIMGLPFFIQFSVIDNNWLSKASNDGWASFFGSYLGGVIGGIGTLIAMLVTTRETRRIQEENKEMQNENKELQVKNTELTQQSLEITQAMAERDKNREIENVKENALIVYYDLYLGLNDVKKLYVSRCIKDYNNAPELMFFNSEWIKNVAALREKFRKQDIKLKGVKIDCIEEIYSLYGELLTIKTYLEQKKVNRGLYEDLLETAVERLSKKFIKNEDVTELGEVATYFSSGIIDMEKTYNYYLANQNSIGWGYDQQMKMIDFPKYKEKWVRWNHVKYEPLDIYNGLDEKYSTILTSLTNIIDKKESK